MKIDRVTVRYGELRSSGYPAFSNTRHEVELSAMLEPGDAPDRVRYSLLLQATRTVKLQFGDNQVDVDQIKLPF